MRIRSLKTLFFALALGLPSQLVGADAISQINAIFNTHMSYAGGISAFNSQWPTLTPPTDVSVLTALWNAIGTAAKATPPTDATELSNLQQAFWNGIILPATTTLPLNTDGVTANCDGTANSTLYTALYNASKALCQASCTLITGPVTDDTANGDAGSMQYQLNGFVQSLDLPASITGSTLPTAKAPTASLKKGPKKLTQAKKKPATKPAPAPTPAQAPAPAPAPAAGKPADPTQKQAKKVVKAIVATPNQVRRIQSGR